jgi:[protein-PII] uridylyltransferase
LEASLEGAGWEKFLHPVFILPTIEADSVVLSPAYNVFTLALIRNKKRRIIDDACTAIIECGLPAEPVFERHRANVENMNYSEHIRALREVTQVSSFLKEQRSEINRLSYDNDFGRPLLEKNSLLVDTTINHLFEIICDRLHQVPAPLGLAIIATGGYGRRELAPHSDVDLTFVTAREEDEPLNALIKEMFQIVMDVFLYGANMKVGYAFRPLSELVQLDHQTQTALLDARFICGDEDVYLQFQKAFRSQLLVADFLFQKQAERALIREKHGGTTVFNVEPEIKEGPGGLRDGQVIRWFGQAYYNAEIEQSLTALTEHNILPLADNEAFCFSYEFMLKVRNVLHCIGQVRDILTTEKQEIVANYLGFDDIGVQPGVERFMDSYYRHAETIGRLSSQVGKRCLDSRLDLGVGGLASIGRKIAIVDVTDAAKDPALPLHGCELAQAYNLGYDDSYEQYIQEFVSTKPSPPTSDLCGRVFTRILSAPKGVSKALQTLADQHVLAWLIPEFADVRYLIPYDAAHDYTVGEHCLRVAQFLETLRETTDSKYQDFRRVWADIASADVLILSGLTHDVGKDNQTGGGHSERGAELAAVVGQRLGWSTERTEKLVFLVRHHLLMAEVSRLRDVRLDETIREFTRICTDLETLNMLYLLTCADTQEVGSGVWTEMKGRFLAELHSRAAAALMASSEMGGSGDMSFSYVPDLAKQRERIRRQLAHHNLPLDLVHEHTSRMSAQYLLNTPLDEIYLHMAMIDRLRQTGQPTVDLKTEFGSDYTEATIIAYDDTKPGLFAKIAGVLYALDLNLYASQVFTRGSSVRIALDTLWIDFRGKPLSSNKKAEVQETLRLVLTSQLSLTELFEKRKKTPKIQIIHGARIDAVSSDRYSMLEIRAPDEPGVVYRLSQAISNLGWNIHSARVSVWGSRVRATFYITDVDGNKIDVEQLPYVYEALPREEYRSRRSVLGAAKR